MSEDAVEVAPKPENGDSGQHERYLNSRYMALAAELQAGVITPDDFAQRMTEERLALEKNAETDGLTKAFNYKHMIAEVDREILETRGTGLPLGALYIDFDHLKEKNTELGHPRVNQLLEAFSDIVREEITPRAGSFGRMGGEEFLILMPNTTEEQLTELSLTIGDRMSMEVGERAKLPGVRQTVSIGAMCLKPGQTGKDFMVEVNRLMLDAKEGGRNRMVMTKTGGERVEREFKVD
jgi:diguanylate cyclase (GGDEF)-like protein